ncbi:cobalamin B12-binding domain-containing protein [Tropicimonas sp. S265A]|uniref:cobalamin B12-binding domain-containing protein n=1 Tax=Tropicimonas sp. S265A TaxID=3415134 RepID=UPI003C7D8790
MALNLDRYRDAQARLLELKSRLPEDAVTALAREVLDRVAARAAAERLAAPPDAEIAALCAALLSEDPQAGAQYIRAVRARGISVDRVYLGFLAGAARRLGAQWDEDLLTFAEVTLGTSRIFGIVNALQTDDMTPVSSPRRAAVFAAVPEETHTLGVRMAADLLRKDGWEIDLLVDLSHDDLVAAIGAREPPVVGLSAAGTRAIKALSRLVVALKLNDPAIRIVVSGAVVDRDAETLKLLALDGMAADFAAAKDLLEDLCQPHARAGQPRALKKS